MHMMVLFYSENSRRLLWVAVINGLEKQLNCDGACVCVAMCTPRCSGGQVCKAPPHTCQCLRSGGGACTNGKYTNCVYCTTFIIRPL